jgi:hypothetical protein
VSYGYAARTDTSVEKSKLEVDLLLAKNGAGARGIAVDENKGVAMIRQDAHADAAGGASGRVSPSARAVSDVALPYDT